MESEGLWVARNSVKPSVSDKEEASGELLLVIQFLASGPKATIYEQYWIPPGHSISGILNPKVTLYEQYWIPHGRSDSHPDHSGSCIWNPKATLYEKYPIPDYDARGGNLSGKLLLAIQDLASRIQRRPYTKHIGSQTESGIPTLTSQALASGIRRRPYTKKIRSQK